MLFALKMQKEFILNYFTCFKKTKTYYKNGFMNHHLLLKMYLILCVFVYGLHSYSSGDRSENTL